MSSDVIGNYIIYNVENLWFRISDFGLNRVIFYSLFHPVLLQVLFHQDSK